ncbi:HAD-IA family hydrolase [Jannaschia sp. LMIT008]|uniref:HAD-IA family hydrolase n=1 Tax=Jannaschia maritima TaxID=3032585 RepID=UPI002811FB75|nr:HAD-IA family hydrolase [Jannaschia sp. LMIT008]
MVGLRADAVIFDLDGTLVDSLLAIRAAILEVCDAMGLPLPEPAAVRTFVGSGVPVGMRRLLAWAGADAARHDEAVERMGAAYLRVPAEANTVYPGVRNMLAALRDRGLALAVCTNKPMAPTAKVLDGLALGPFDAVVGGDTLPVRKPDPAPLRHAASLLGVPVARALYVGDSEVDHATAAAAGMRFAFVEGGYPNGPMGDPAPALHLAALADLPRAIV